VTSRLPLSALCSVLLISSACDRSAEPGSETVAVTEITPIAGMYEVAGTTIETATGDKREISGTVILAENGERYTATFHLSTAFPGGEGTLPAEVIGQGAGVIEGRTLRGNAATQIVISSIPGIDPGFAYIPRTTTTRIVSESLTTIAADGSVVIEIANEPAAGESYAPTRTTLRGMRIGPQDLAKTPGTPDVAAGPPEGDE